MNIKCPICGTELRQEDRLTKRRKTVYTMLECPRNPKHFRGFIHDNDPESSQPSLSKRERELQYQLVVERELHQVFMDSLTLEEKELIRQRMRAEKDRIDSEAAELERKARDIRR